MYLGMIAYGFFLAALIFCAVVLQKHQCFAGNLRSTMTMANDRIEPAEPQDSPDCIVCQEIVRRHLQEKLSMKESCQDLYTETVCNNMHLPKQVVTSEELADIITASEKQLRSICYRLDKCTALPLPPKLHPRHHNKKKV